MSVGNGARQILPPPRLAINDIIATIGSDVDARNVIAMVLTHAMAHRGRQQFFLANQVRNEWLPLLQGVDLVRLAETEIAGYLSGCGSYWIISHLERTDRIVSIRLAEKCGGTELHYIVSVDGSEWRLGPPGTGKDGGGWAPGIGSGSVGSPPGCPCLNR